MNKIIHYITRPFYKIFSIWQGMSTTLKFLICGICLIVGSTATIISIGNSTASNQTSHEKVTKPPLTWIIKDILDYNNSKKQGEKFSPYKLSCVKKDWLKKGSMKQDGKNIYSKNFVWEELVGRYYIANQIKLSSTSSGSSEFLSIHSSVPSHADSDYIDSTIDDVINVCNTNTSTPETLNQLQSYLDHFSLRKNRMLTDQILEKGFYSQIFNNLSDAYNHIHKTYNSSIASKYTKHENNTPKVDLKSLHDLSFEIHKFFQKLYNIDCPSLKDIVSGIATKNKDIPKSLEGIKIEITTKIYYKDK